MTAGKTARWKRRVLSPFRGSIGLTLAVAVLLASLGIGLSLGTTQLAYIFLEQRGEALELTEEILDLAEGAATTASWTLDEQLAREVIESVVALGDVESSILLDESGIRLAQALSDEHDHDPLTQFFARVLFRRTFSGTRSLVIDAGDQQRSVGTMTINLDSEASAERFLAIAKPTFLAALVQAMAIALVLLSLSSRLVTTPIRRAAEFLESVHPKRPDEPIVPIPKAHQSNELGHLLEHTNKTVQRLVLAQHELQELATHDPLTKLPNRHFVVGQLDQALARSNRAGSQTAVLFLDLDDFKSINDIHGHEKGDELLVGVANRLAGTLRTHDTLGRLGGDEFLAVLEDVEQVEEATTIAERLAQELQRPFEFDEWKAVVGASIGVAVYPRDGSTSSDLVRHADLAMYQAKISTKGSWKLFSPSMSDQALAQRKVQTELVSALENDRFLVHYQPKVCAGTGAISGCEALLRWRTDDERVVPAGEFVAAAERSGIIVDIGYRVLELVCEQSLEWAQQGTPLPIAVNISARQLREPDFVERVEGIVSRHHIDPRTIELEITETVLIKELSQAMERLTRLRAIGFPISIDDFGTGYSSLAYLTHLPASSLKIDRSFVSGPQESDAVLDMIIAMAKALRLSTVAEGVETEEQRVQLIEKGCDTLQGYLLGRPMSPTDFKDQFLSPEQAS